MPSTSTPGDSGHWRLTSSRGRQAQWVLPRGTQRFKSMGRCSVPLLAFIPYVQEIAVASGGNIPPTLVTSAG